MGTGDEEESLAHFGLLKRNTIDWEVYNNSNLRLTVLETGLPKIKVPQIHIWYGPIPASYMPVFLL